jgi:hypothetical protein
MGVIQRVDRGPVIVLLKRDGLLHNLCRITAAVQNIVFKSDLPEHDEQRMKWLAFLGTVEEFARAVEAAEFDLLNPLSAQVSRACDKALKQTLFAVLDTLSQVAGGLHTEVRDWALLHYLELQMVLGPTENAAATAAAPKRASFTVHESGKAAL